MPKLASIAQSMHIKGCWPATANDKKATQPSDCAEQGISAANATPLPELRVPDRKLQVRLNEWFGL
jgi:hypothetical protein